MKKFLLVSALSCLFYSAPGYAAGLPGDAEKELAGGLKEELELQCVALLMGDSQKCDVTEDLEEKSSKETEEAKEKFEKLQAQLKGANKEWEQAFLNWERFEASGGEHESKEEGNRLRMELRQTGKYAAELNEETEQAKEEWQERM